MVYKTKQKPQILIAKTQGFYKVVRASAVTHRKRQISKVVTPPIPDYHTLRAYNRTETPPHNDCSYKRAPIAELKRFIDTDTLYNSCIEN